MKFHPIATITAMLLALPFSAFGQANCVPDPENDIFCGVVNVPEQSTMALFAAGIGAALFIARRRKR